MGMARLASALCWAQLALAGKPQVAYGTQAELAAVVDGLGVEAQRQTVAAVLGAIAVGDEASVDLAPADARRRAAAREAARVLLEGEMLEWLMMTDEQVARALQPGALQPEPARRSDDRTLGGGTLAPAVAANTASVVAGYPRQLQGGGGGSDICPSPDSASLVASTREHRQLNFTGDYTAAGQPLCSWRIECEPGTKDPAVLLRFHSLSTYYGGDATPPLGAGDAVRVYPDPDQDDYVELMGPLSAQPSSFGVPFEQSFGAAGGTMRVELSFAWGQTAGFAADYWCVSAHVLEPGCTDSAANNFDASANADDGSCDYGDVPALLSAAFQVDPAGQMPYGWGTDNDPCVSGVPDCEGWQGVFCHKFTMGETTASRPVWVTPGWREDVSLTVGDDIGRLHSLMQVDLSNSGLHGVLTESLGGMRALNSLSLWGTALSGTMPDGIGGLNQLQTLDLDATRLSGTIPGAIGQLASLKMLQLYDTQLSGSMPTELLELKGLEQLSLSRCKISGSLANSISGMESLNTLHMANCRLTGSLPSSLGDMAALQDLDLSGTNIDGTIPTEVGRMSSLRTLALSHTRISGVLMPELAMVTGLESLDLGHTATSGTLIDELGDMKSLEVLGLGSTHITGTLIDALSGMTALEQFSMATTGINGTIPKSLLSLTQLQRVQLQDTGLSGTLPPAIHSWTAMKILDLPNCHLSGTIPSGVGSMTALTELSLHSNFMSGTLPAEINLLANLKSLYLNTMELSGPLPDMSGCVGLRVLRLTNNSFTALPPALPPNVTHVYLDQQPMNATGDALCQLKPQSVQVLSIAFSAVPILLEATDGPECHLDGGCRGTWVTPPSSCRIGQDCNWHLELRDALDEAATVGGRMHNLFIGYNCSDTERRNSCAVVEPMVDNRNGTFTATVPGDRDTGRPWIDPDRPWIEMQGKHHFSFFHEEHGFFPSTDGDGGHSAIVAVQLNTTTFLPRECPDAHTVADTTTGSVCVCEGPSAKAPQGFHRGNRLGQSSCEINCPLGQQTRDGSTCECADGYYNPELAGTVACVLQDWPPTPVAWSSARERYDGSALITDYGEAKCLPCPHDCATCKDGSINSMAGWRLNGTVDSKDLSERLMLFQPRGANVLYRCPNGSSYGSVLSNESSFTVCPSLPLDNTALHDVRIHTTCQLERVGPLCQSCGPDSLADGDGLCGPCPKYDTDLYGKCAGLALVAGLVLVALLYLVSWTREDTKVANEMISTMAELSRTLSNQTSLNSQTSSLNSQTSLNSQDSVNSTRYKISLEQPLTSLDSDGLRREPSVGMPELFEEQRANVERDHQAMRTVCMQLAFQSARILISYAQVVTQLGAVLHVQLPPVFENAIDKLKVLTVDMSAFLRLHDVHFMDCLSVYQRWEVYVGIVPVVMLAIVLLLHIVDKWRGLESVADKSKIRSYFILFLVYPSVCRESFSLFNCRKLGEGYRVLLEDYDLDCDDEDYTTYRHIAMLVIVVFIAGVPVGLFYLLWRKIRATRRQELEEEYIIASLAREGRELLGTFSKETAKDVLQTVQAGQTSFFAAGYKGRYYFWESLDMCRKLLLVRTGIVLVDSDCL
jgi:Leucine-rich repeat (LRR) protein